MSNNIDNKGVTEYVRLDEQTNSLKFDSTLIEGTDKRKQEIEQAVGKLLESANKVLCSKDGKDFSPETVKLSDLAKEMNARIKEVIDSTNDDLSKNMDALRNTSILLATICSRPNVNSPKVQVETPQTAKAVDTAKTVDTAAKAVDTAKTADTAAKTVEVSSANLNFSKRIEDIDKQEAGSDRISSSLLEVKESLGVTSLSNITDGEIKVGLSSFNGVQNNWKLRELKLPDSVKISFLSQAFLARNGYTPGTIDGLMGDNTKGAVKRFQEARNKDNPDDKITVDGHIGPQTVSKMIDWDSEKTAKQTAQTATDVTKTVDTAQAADARKTTDQAAQTDQTDQAAQTDQTDQAAQTDQTAQIDQSEQAAQIDQSEQAVQSLNEANLQTVKNILGEGVEISGKTATMLVNWEDGGYISMKKNEIIIGDGEGSKSINTLAVSGEVDIVDPSAIHKTYINNDGHQVVIVSGDSKYIISPVQGKDNLRFAKFDESGQTEWSFFVSKDGKMQKIRSDSDTTEV